MPLRIIEIYIPGDRKDKLDKLLDKNKSMNVWSETLPGNFIHAKLLVKTEEAGPLLDELEKKFSALEGFRAIVLKAEATIPKPAEEEKPQEEGEKSTSVSRQELYQDIEESTSLTWIYILMVVLSSIVAAVGLLRNNIAIVIGAMVIAPLLGPNVALAFSITLGDLKLAQKAGKTFLVGIMAAIAVSALTGFFMEVNPSMPEILSRTNPDLGDVIIALAAGAAGVLSFTRGLPSALIGVMVAVSLLPPLVVAGLLFGAGEVSMGLGALVLFLTNVAAINVAGIVTFLVQGIKPARWWEESKARKASLIALSFWIILLAFLVYVLLIW